MKIRDKLSIQFTALVAAILLLLCLMIYYVSAIQHRNEFFKELVERTHVTAYIYLERDGFSREIYTAITERYIQALPQEKAQLYDMNNKPSFIEPDELVVEDNILNYIRENYVYPQAYEFYIDNSQATGLFYQDNQGDYVVIVTAVDSIGETFLYNLAWILVIGFSLCLIVILISGRFFAKQVLKPIPRIVKQVNRISATNLNVRLNGANEDDELGELVKTFNEMFSRLEENFEVQNRFVANASHELRTPLTSIIGEVEVALTKNRSREEYEKVLNSIHHEALALHQLISGLLELAQAESERLNQLSAPVYIDELVVEAAIQTEKKYPESKINVMYQNPSPNSAQEFLYFGSEPLLYNVFLNVLDNAVKFSDQKAVVDVRLQASADWIEVQVRDYGMGISEEDMGMIFNPFYRSNDVIAENGYGIGLSFVQRVLNVLNGTISYDNQLSKGVKATIRFYKEKSKHKSGK